jgi:hypothetical protein
MVGYWPGTAVLDIFLLSFKKPTPCIEQNSGSGHYSEINWRFLDQQAKCGEMISALCLFLLCPSYCTNTVPDRRRRIVPEIVLVRRWVTGVLGIWRGEGWEGVGTGEVSLQATWDRGGRILSQLGGFQVSRRGLKGEQGETKGNQQGERKSKGNAPCIL